ncbi:MAG: type II secretion system minor pseudopilin GspI [Pseudomonadota bacterium]
MRARDCGFTLVEVMVALFIVAVTVPALLFTLDQQLDGTAYLRERSLARLVAGNRLAELRLALRSGRGNLRGRLTGSDVLAERDWYWQIVTTATDVPDLSRVEIRVSDREGENADSLFTLVAFLSVEQES